MQDGGLRLAQSVFRITVVGLGVSFADDKYAAHNVVFDENVHI